MRPVGLPALKVAFRAAKSRGGVTIIRRLHRDLPDRSRGRGSERLRRLAALRLQRWRMRSHRERETLRLVLAIAAQAGAQLLTIERSGRGHPRAIFERNGTQVAVGFSASGDWRARANTLAAARRLLNE
jgi:hypothetical protein